MMAVHGVKGFVQVFVPADLSQFDEVSVTEELVNVTGVRPTTVVRWYGVVTSAEPAAPVAP